MRKRALLGALLVVGLGVVLGATVFRTDIAQATGLADKPTVVVVNTPAQAVPVREQNLDGGNIKVHEQGTANVRVVDGHQPFTLRLDAGLNDGEFFGDESRTVPAGQRMVVQYIGVSAEVPANQGVSLGYRAGSGVNVVNLPIVSGGLKRTSAGDFVDWAGGGPVLFYLDAGQNITIEIDRASSITPSQAPGSALMHAIVSGYFVPSS